MFMVNTIFKALFVEMYVKIFFVKLLVQRNEFNLCLKMVLYKSYLSIYLSICVILLILLFFFTIGFVLRLITIIVVHCACMP